MSVRKRVRNVVIMRGLPGSGKSYTARRLAENAEQDGQTCEIHSTDNYFMNKGVYEFNSCDLSRYHRFNQNAFMGALRAGVENVIVDNCNCKCFEFFPYAVMANMYGYNIQFMYPESKQWIEVVRSKVIQGRPPVFSPEETLISYDKNVDIISTSLSAKSIHGVPPEVIAGMIRGWEGPGSWPDVAVEILKKGGAL